MNCPACRNDLSEHEVQLPNGSVINFNTCSQCGGIWLENFNLKKLMKQDSFPYSFIPQYQPPPGLILVKEGERACPICYSQLTLIEDHGVKVDICKACKAIWFDGFELQQLYDEMREEVGFVHSPQPQNPNQLNALPRASGPAITPANIQYSDDWGSLETSSYSRRGSRTGRLLLNALEFIVDVFIFPRHYY